MLSELCKGVLPQFTVIVDSVENSGRSLFNSLVKTTAMRGDLVQVFHFEQSKVELTAGFEDGLVSQMLFHDCFSDPVGWNCTEGILNEPLERETFREMVQKSAGSIGSRPITVAFDSLSPLLWANGWPRLCHALHSLVSQHSKHGMSSCRLLCLLHCDVHPSGETAAVCHMANTTLTVLTPPPKQALSSSVGEMLQIEASACRQSGRGAVEKATVTLDADLTANVLLPTMFVKEKLTEDVNSKNDPTADLPFNLRLSDDERCARDGLVLPFYISAKRKQAILQGADADEGQIFYLPDREDDFDEEDPDDDLDI
uniref:Elongator complex protein 5 n=1 Tax=Eptatretus burgeri TaxID=7764 RepID=A0A8C4QXR2_EPTBU